MASDSSSSVERVGDAHVAGDVFEIFDLGIRLKVQRTPFVAIQIFDGTNRPQSMILDPAEAKFLGKFLLGGN